ncbi:MAG: TIGR00725 family protein [Patescibacteria group bacterium]
MQKIIIGVMGPGESAAESDREHAYQMGKLIAQAGWVLLTGGRNRGVMDAASKGAKEHGGLTIGILPTSDPNTVSDAVDMPIFTEMKSARNNINVLSSRVIVVCGMSAGTASEVAMALVANKPIILIDQNKISKDFFQTLGKEKVNFVDTPLEALDKIKHLL